MPSTSGRRAGASTASASSGGGIRGEPTRRDSRDRSAAPERAFLAGRGGQAVELADELAAQRVELGLAGVLGRSRGLAKPARQARLALPALLAAPPNRGRMAQPLRAVRAGLAA